MHAKEFANTTYLWVYVIIGVATIVGFGIAGARWLKRQAVAEAAVKALVDADLLQQIADLRRAMRPNGLDTNEIGDIARRTEIKVDSLMSKLDQHIGSSDQTHKDLWRAIHRKDRE